MAQRLWIYDTTLRDGCQHEGISFSCEDKLKIARCLDDFGIPFIEGGWPGANPKDSELFERLKEEPLQTAEIVAFGSTRRPSQTAANDSLLQKLLSAGTHYITIFGKSWDFHVTEVLKTNLDENLAMIRDTISFLVLEKREVIYDAEHWFDGYKQNREYAMKTIETAVEAGAKWLVFCDTNGGTLPHEITQIVRQVIDFIRAHYDQSIKLGIHAHNDSETAVANSLAAIREGVSMVQGTINGYGERCGNANLCSLIPDLQLKLGFDCIPNNNLVKLTGISRFIDELVNFKPDNAAPFVGHSAFTHKGGIHVSAVKRNSISYEHIQPETVGNSRRILISEQSGLSNILAKACQFNVDLDRQKPICRQILQKLKDLENQGYQFEAADGSFALLMMEAVGERELLFELESFQVLSEVIKDNSQSKATITILVNGKKIVVSGEEEGPVESLDVALHKALVDLYPEIVQFKLMDYKVRILESQNGTKAKVRVLARFSDGTQNWSTIGVSRNIIKASCQALIEGLEYGLLSYKRTKIPRISAV